MEEEGWFDCLTQIGVTVREIKDLHRSRYSDKGNPPFLFNVPLLSRNDPFNQSDEKDHREFKTLAFVNGHEGNAILVLCHLFLKGIRVFEKGLDIGISSRCQLELIQILDFLIVRTGNIRIREMPVQIQRIPQELDDLCGIHVVDEIDQMVHELDEIDHVYPYIWKVYPDFLLHCLQPVIEMQISLVGKLLHLFHELLPDIAVGDIDDIDKRFISGIRVWSGNDPEIIQNDPDFISLVEVKTILNMVWESCVWRGSPRPPSTGSLPCRGLLYRYICNPVSLVRLFH